MQNRKSVDNRKTTPAGRMRGSQPTDAGRCWLLTMLWLGFGLAGAMAGEQAAPPVESVNAELEAAPATVDRSSPFATVNGFLSACDKGNFEAAIHYFDMAAYKGMSKFSQHEAASRDAKNFYRLYQASVADKETFRFPCLRNPQMPLSTTAEGVYPEKRPDGQELVPDNADVVGMVDILGGRNEIWLRRVTDAKSQKTVWLFTSKTLTSLTLWKTVKLDGVTLPERIEINPGLAPLSTEDAANLHRSTPKRALDGFQRASADANWNLAAHYLDLGAELAPRGPQLARRLSMIFERIGVPESNELADSFFGNRNEADLEVDQELVFDLGTLDASIVKPAIRGRITLWIRRDANDADGKMLWLVSRPTVESIDEWYDQLGYGWIGDTLPQFFFTLQFLGLQLWQWLGILLLLVLALVLQFLAVGLLFWMLGRWSGRTESQWDDKVIAAARMPARVFITAFLLITMAGPLALRREVFEILALACRTVEVVSFVWLGYRLVDVGALAICRMADRHNQNLDTTLFPLLSRIMKVAVVVVGGLFILQNLDVNVTGLIAALGVGGIAVALAGQKTVENLLGSIIIAIDRPFKIGNFCKVGDYLGVIEDIGLRSTRVRTLDRTLVTIPNGKLSDMTIENFAHRDRIRWVSSIGVTYSATIEQIKYVVDEVKKLILAHPKTFNEDIVVRFASFGNYSQNIDVICFVTTTDYLEFTAVREELCFEFARIVAESGAGFAFPSQTIYLGKHSGADPDLQRKIAAEIQRRSQVGELTIPEPSPELLEKLVAQSAASAEKFIPAPDPEKQPWEKPAAEHPKKGDGDRK